MQIARSFGIIAYSAQFRRQPAPNAVKKVVMTDAKLKTCQRFD